MKKNIMQILIIDWNEFLCQTSTLPDEKKGSSSVS